MIFGNKDLPSSDEHRDPVQWMQLLQTRAQWRATKVCRAILELLEKRHGFSHAILPIKDPAGTCTQAVQILPQNASPLPLNEGDSKDKEKTRWQVKAVSSEGSLVQRRCEQLFPPIHVRDKMVGSFNNW